MTACRIETDQRAGFARRAPEDATVATSKARGARPNRCIGLAIVRVTGPERYRPRAVPAAGTATKVRPRCPEAGTRRCERCTGSVPLHEAAAAPGLFLLWHLIARSLEGSAVARQRGGRSMAPGASKPGLLGEGRPRLDSGWSHRGRRHRHDNGRRYAA